jgi:hypothetical protein
VPLYRGLCTHDHPGVFRKQAWSEEDVTAILTVLFDSHRELSRIRRVFEDDEDEEEKD